MKAITPNLLGIGWRNAYAKRKLSTITIINFNLMVNKSINGIEILSV